MSDLPEIVIEVKAPPKDVKIWTVLGIDSRVLQVIPRNADRGFLVKFVDDKGNESPVMRVTTMEKLASGVRRRV